MGDFYKIKRCLRNGFDLNELVLNGFWNTFLCAATSDCGSARFPGCRKRFLALMTMKELLDVNLPNGFGYSPLHYAPNVLLRTPLFKLEQMLMQLTLLAVSTFRFSTALFKGLTLH